MASSSSRSKDQKNDEKKEDEEEEIKLPPPLGYKFFPSEEILMDYVKLRNGIVDGTRKLPLHVIPTIENLYSFNPDQIPFHKFIGGVEGEWFFFTNSRSDDHNLVTPNGYWHPKTLPIEIELENTIIGLKQTFTFHWGIPSNGKESKFLIHEYKLNKEGGNFVACRVRDMEAFSKGQKEEEDWNSDFGEVHEGDSEDDEN